jgi:hypothetical protein
MGTCLPSRLVSLDGPFHLHAIDEEAEPHVGGSYRHATWRIPRTGYDASFTPAENSLGVLELGPLRFELEALESIVSRSPAPTTAKRRHAFHRDVFVVGKP